MAKTFDFEWQRCDMRETEKAYGFAYTINGKVAGVDYVGFDYLPKSQISVTDVTIEMYADEHGEFEANHYWHDGIVWVSVPMWLASKHDYFKKLGF